MCSGLIRLGVAHRHIFADVHLHLTLDLRLLRTQGVLPVAIDTHSVDKHASEQT
jgi:hypothetical protein